MATTASRKEYHTTKVVRTLSPHQRTLSSENLAEFDNKLDNLLEDLQNSVSRPGSSLGNAYRETRTATYSNKNDSLGRIQNLSAANPTTVINEQTSYSYKPGGETVKTVKTYREKNYSYNVNTDMSPEKARMQTNINKLDTLLDDLQQARQGTLDRDAGIDSGLLEPVTGSSGRHQTNKKTVHRELVYDSDSSQRRGREGSVEREVVINEGQYGDLRPIRHQSPTRSGTLQSTKSYNYSSESRNSTLNTRGPKTEIIETINPDINPNVLAQLDANLLPPPNTKVTTTIKTYTYEIPGNGYPSAVSPQLSETIYSSNPTTPSKSFSYNKVESTNVNNTNTTLSPYPGSYVRPSSPNPIGFTRTVTETSRDHTDNYPKRYESPNVTKKTYNIYNETTTKNINERVPRSPHPPEKHVHIYNKTTTTNVNQPPPNQNGYPVGAVLLPNDPNTIQTTYIINETNTKQNINQYPNGQVPQHVPGGNYPPGTTIYYKHDTKTSHNFDGPPENYPRDPNLNITYKYSSQNNTTNKYRGHPNDEMEPLLAAPMPFPTGPGDVEGPPKKLDQLLAEIGNEPPNNSFNAGYNAKQAEIAHKKEVDKLTSHSEVQQKKEVKDLPKSKNIAGPPVYYPPGHEMFSHKEEAAGGYSAEGGYMKESGKYQYEASSKSKQKSSSGMAVVPVCLPLCCGLPCVIM